MLEYTKEETIDDKYFLGFQEGYLDSTLALHKTMAKKLLDKTNPEMIKKVYDCIRVDTAAFDYNMDMIRFVIRYSGVNKNTLARRYIAESEFLPWR